MTGDVYMNHGRWIVDCPGCSWSYSAMSEDPRVGRIWLPWQRTHVARPLAALVCKGDSRGKGCGTRFAVEWPPLDETLEIERALFKRPSRANRNWRRPETADTLLTENDAFLVGWTVKDLADHGIGVI